MDKETNTNPPSGSNKKKLIVGIVAVVVIASIAGATYLFQNVGQEGQGKLEITPKIKDSLIKDSLIKDSLIKDSLIIGNSCKATPGTVNTNELVTWTTNISNPPDEEPTYTWTGTYKDGDETTTGNDDQKSYKYDIPGTYTAKVNIKYIKFIPSSSSPPAPYSAQTTGEYNLTCSVIVEDSATTTAQTAADQYAKDAATAATTAEKEKDIAEKAASDAQDAADDAQESADEATIYKAAADKAAADKAAADKAAADKAAADKAAADKAAADKAAADKAAADKAAADKAAADKAAADKAAVDKAAADKAAADKADAEEAAKNLDEKTESTTTYSENEQCAGFPDVSKEDENCDAYTFAKESGLFEGHDETGFLEKSKKFNRASIAKIAASLSTRYKNNEDYCTSKNLFPDIDIDEWFADFTCYLKDEGIITGYKSGRYTGKYVGEQLVTRAEYIAILTRTLNTKLDQQPQQFNFTDVVKTPDAWYFDYMQYAYINGLYDGQMGYPEQNVSRGEAAEILYKLNILGEL